MKTTTKINQLVDRLNKIPTQINQKLRRYDFEGADKLFQYINRFRDIRDSWNYGSSRFNLEDTNRISQSIDRLYNASDYHQLRNKYVRKYIEPKLEKIEQQLRCYNFESANELFEDISHLYNASDYKQLRDGYAREYIIEKITPKLHCYDFESADRLFKHIRKLYPKSEYDQLRRHYVDKYITLTFNRIEQQLRLYDFESADQLFQSISISNLSQVEYQRLKVKYQRLKAEYTKKQVLETITALLNNEEYIAADKHFCNSSLILAEEYENLKSRYVKKSLAQEGLELNDEQSLAMSKMDKHLLLAARAGSGKTRTIEGKTLFLAKHEAVNPNQILILAFNKAAAKEIQDRICRADGLENFNNARTFHSLAYQIVDPEPDTILFDEKGEFSRKELSVFVQKIFQDLRKADPTIEKRLYLYFRKELQEINIERYRKIFSDKEYLTYRRNLKYVTLNREQVKSRGEKYIADFLFEHDIKYQYEKVHSWGNGIYRPDFTLLPLKMGIIIEHWGIDEHDSKQEVPSHWNKTWKEYHDEIQRKRDYCQKRGWKLVETSIRDLRFGRENFEKKLKSELEHVGIKRQKLPESTIIKGIVESPHITRMTELFVQFIQRAKQSGRTVAELQYEINQANNDDRTQIFLKIANQVYSEYNQAIKKHNKMDFNDLIDQAIKIIDKCAGGTSIAPDTNAKIKNLKWILIDEYQDFSKLFYRLIQSVRKHNADIRLFCVGDDWQAIYGFAGSDLDYFDNFERIIENSGTAHLLTNHRSNKKIVEGGNALMEGRGKPSTPHRETEGLVHIECVDDVKIEAHTNPRDPQEKEQDRKFLFQPQPDDYFLKAKYLKRCYQIITDNPGKTVTILARTNRIYGTELVTFKNKLKRCFKAEQSGRFQISIEQGDVRTVHDFKGSEADIVIILQACNGMFPLIHPDNHLFEIFGYTIKDTFDEERRLFYVAITRAKEKLYILTERDRESDFLDVLEGRAIGTGKYDDIPFFS